jgi:hypothetical protein
MEGRKHISKTTEKMPKVGLPIYNVMVFRPRSALRPRTENHAATCVTRRFRTGNRPTDHRADRQIQRGVGEHRAFRRSHRDSDTPASLDLEPEQHAADILPTLRAVPSVPAMISALNISFDMISAFVPRSFDAMEAGPTRRPGSRRAGPRSSSPEAARPTPPVRAPRADTVVRNSEPLQRKCPTERF